jgi:hypothetical protein
MVLAVVVEEGRRLAVNDVIHIPKVHFRLHLPTSHEEALLKPMMSSGSGSGWNGQIKHHLKKKFRKHIRGIPVFCSLDSPGVVIAQLQLLKAHARKFRSNMTAHDYLLGVMASALSHYTKSRCGRYLQICLHLQPWLRITHALVSGSSQPEHQIQYLCPSRWLADVRLTNKRPRVITLMRNFTDEQLHPKALPNTFHKFNFMLMLAEELLFASISQPKTAPDKALNGVIPIHRNKFVSTGASSAPTSSQTSSLWAKSKKISALKTQLVHAELLVQDCVRAFELIKKNTRNDTEGTCGTHTINFTSLDHFPTFDDKLKTLLDRESGSLVVVYTPPTNPSISSSSSVTGSRLKTVEKTVPQVPQVPLVSRWSSAAATTSSMPAVLSDKKTYQMPGVCEFRWRKRLVVQLKQPRSLGARSDQTVLMTKAAKLGFGRFLQSILPDSLTFNSDLVNLLLLYSEELWHLVCYSLFQFAYHMVIMKPRKDAIVASFLRYLPIPQFPLCCTSTVGTLDEFIPLVWNKLEETRQEYRLLKRFRKTKENNKKAVLEVRNELMKMMPVMLNQEHPLSVHLWTAANRLTYFQTEQKLLKAIHDAKTEFGKKRKQVRFWTSQPRSPNKNKKPTNNNPDKPATTSFSKTPIANNKLATTSVAASSSISSTAAHGRSQSHRLPKPNSSPLKEKSIERKLSEKKISGRKPFAMDANKSARRKTAEHERRDRRRAKQSAANVSASVAKAALDLAHTKLQQAEAALRDFRLRTSPSPQKK